MLACYERCQVGDTDVVCAENPARTKVAKKDDQVKHQYVDKDAIEELKNRVWFKIYHVQSTA